MNGLAAVNSFFMVFYLFDFMDLSLLITSNDTGGHVSYTGLEILVLHMPR